MRALVFACMWQLSLAASADGLQDRFNTVWESLWYQGGSPTTVARWSGDIRVRIQGRDVSMHQERILKSLELVAGVAGRKVVHVAGAADAADPANLDVEIVGERDLQGNQACYVRLEEVDAGVIKRASLKMRTDEVYECVLHEAMHVMGILGHPSGDTVLSYFNQRVAALSGMDRIMLAAWYSEAMRPGMTPMAALSVLTRAVVAADGGKTPDAMNRRTLFLLETLRDMEAFAGDAGDIPMVLKRSGTASAASMRDGKRRMAFYLGLTYVRGEVVARRPDKAADWFERGARDNFGPSQMMLAYLFEQGDGLLKSPTDAFVWYSLAAGQGYEAARNSAERLAQGLSAQERLRADARIASLIADPTWGYVPKPAPAAAPPAPPPVDTPAPAQQPEGELCDARSHQDLNVKCRSQAPARAP